MKRRFAARGVPTAAQLNALDSYPLFVKPDVSYASCGLSDASVVWDAAAALARAAAVASETVQGGVFVESFLAGREFTAMVVDGADGAAPQCWTVAERVFDARLPTFWRFLDFDRCWAGCIMPAAAADDRAHQSAPPKLEGDKVAPTMPWSYAAAPDAARGRLGAVACAAYSACAGRSYGRVDMRTRAAADEACKNVCVLEVNSQPGLSFEQNSDLSDMLFLAGVQPTEFVRALVENALVRHRRGGSPVIFFVFRTPAYCGFLKSV